ncbi:MAG: hypothetical protein A2749_03025 [Parcubacteria group bacterium RIFCSPHIGHO2_01_FULL_45_26]|nr:MAG: hypothetical protein A2749_03025 [Parcubacteria group bacterium RIFCSPHIGHO2_01_FULL_45_26]
MDKEELVEILTEHFPTKDEFSNLVRRVVGIEGSLEEMNDKLDNLTASAGALDNILEAYPVERIQRLETHANLSPFVSQIHEE